MSRVISVEDLGKKYLLKHQAPQGSYVALRDVLSDGVRQLGSRLLGRGARGAEREEFWALKGVSFQVNQGDRVGIIGRNGAGKSTLLKVLSRITEPTTGSVRIRGRVASLLEVGTGFHPELTGRENIYLNGAILGMGRAEIRRKFDEIVEFAEVERFLDTPVKRYSSGMYVRLAFAVAAHLETEILVVDEVLSVGDAQFQKKCLGKMEDVGKQGRTLLYVSHNMGTISSLCQTGILLESGMIATAGTTADVVLAYYSNGVASPACFDYTGTNKIVGDSHAVLLSGAVVDHNRDCCTEVDIRNPVSIVMRYRILAPDNFQLFPNFHFYYSDGTCAFVTSDVKIAVLSAGVYESTCCIPGNLLNDGTYFVGLALTSLGYGVQVHFQVQGALTFNVKDPVEDVPTRNSYSGPIPGIMRPLVDWSSRSLE
jgi:lipopolysaccharide transport system ATP-binding protein